MKAIRVHQFGPPEVMQLEELPIPRPGPGQILVSVRAAGVNPVDTYIRNGLYAATSPLPYTPGLDGAGTVEAIGPDVTRHAVGNRVYFSGGSGSHAECAVVSRVGAA